MNIVKNAYEAMRLAAAGEKPRCEWRARTIDGIPSTLSPFGSVVSLHCGRVSMNESPHLLAGLSFNEPGWTVTAAQITCEMNARKLLMSPAEKAGPQLLEALEQVPDDQRTPAMRAAIAAAKEPRS